MKHRQLPLFCNRTEKTHGGSKTNGRRKGLRPLSTKNPIHLVLKTTNPFLLLRNTEIIEQAARKYAQKFGIIVYELAVQADHIHLSFKIPSRDLYRRWIRALTSVLVLKISKLKWSFSPFTRVGAWGRDFKRLGRYIRFNSAESSLILWGHLQVDQYRHELNARFGLSDELSE